MSPPRRTTGLAGPWSTVFALLASPWATWVLLVWIAITALVGLTAVPGAHPAEGLGAHLPVALLPFTVLARAVATGGVRLAAGLWVAGLAVAAVGAVVAGSGAGLAEVGGPSVTESYLRPMAGQAVPVHLGGQLTRAAADGRTQLRLGVPTVELATATLPPGEAAEVPLGPWAIHRHEARPGAEATVARLRLRPRAGEGETIERTLRVGDAFVTPDGVQILLRRLSPDFGRALGPAAQLTLSQGDDSETAWYFVEDPALDARVGRWPWIVELQAVDAGARLLLGVRRAGPVAPALAGWALMGLALLIGAVRKEPA